MVVLRWILEGQKLVRKHRQERILGRANSTTRTMDLEFMPMSWPGGILGTGHSQSTPLGSLEQQKEEKQALG